MTVLDIISLNSTCGGFDIMKLAMKRIFPKPFLSFYKNIASEVNSEFESLTGFSREVLLGKTLFEINKMLRIESQVMLEDFSDKQSLYIFTKELEPREVEVSCINGQLKNEQIYFFREKRNSRFDKLLPYVIATMQNNQTGVVIYSAGDGVVLKVNEKFLRYLKVPITNIGNYIGKGIEEISSEFDKSVYKDIFYNVVKTGEPFYSKEFQVFDEFDVYWDVSLVPIRISGEVKYIVYTVSDVTEKVVGRRIAEEQKQELEAIIENMSDGLFVLDKDYKLTPLNSVARAYKRESDYLKYFDGTLESQYYDLDGNLLTFESFPIFKVLKGEKLSCYRYSLHRPDGEYYLSLSGSPLYDGSGNVVKALICTRDITEQVKKDKFMRRQTEDNLYIKAQYDILDRIIKNLDFGILRCSYSDLRIIDYNNKAYNDLKQILPDMSSLNNIKGMVLTDFFSSYDDELEEKLKNINFEISKNSKYTTLKGDERSYRIISQPLYGMNNEIIEIIFISIDITEEVKSREEMEDTLKVQDEIFANASHELKTPLSVIFSANQIMDMYLSNDVFDENKDKFLIYNNIIKQNCFRLTRLINNITDLTKCKSGYDNFIMSNENIVDIIENITQLVSEYVKSKGMRIVFDTDVEEKIIACDTNKIERIVLNLISNAIKFSTTNSEIFVSIHDRGDVLEIKVEDTGMGIDEKHLGSIFDRYYQADKSISRVAEGSGIGLSLIKEFVELHGGNIRVESELGKGSIFIIEFPVRIIESSNPKGREIMSNKIDMINIEFSDIYNLV